MTPAAKLTSAIMFVRDLDRSVRFYTELLGLDVLDRDTTAALLASQDGSALILRAMGSTAVHELGGTGIQFLTWAVGSAEELARCEQVLRDAGAYVETRKLQELTAVEGHDPDRIAVVICHPGPDQIPPERRRLWTRIYAW